MSIKIQYDDLRKGEVNTAGGIFKLKDETRILIHKGLSTEEKVDKLLTLFASLDTETVHLSPIIRKRLESYTLNVEIKPDTEAAQTDVSGSQLP